MLPNRSATQEISSTLMRPYTKAISGFLFPLHERIKGHTTTSVLREMERTQYLPVDELRRYQDKRLRDFIARVVATVPFYRDLFSQLGLAPNDVSSVADLAKLPLLTKPIIRDHTEALMAEGVGTLQRFNTGGSSGEPLIFYLGKERVSHDVAAKWRATRWWDVDIGDPEIVVWGSPVELGAQDRVRAVRDSLLRTRLLPAFEMSDAKVSDFLSQIRATRPKMLFGYPSSMSHIARHAQRAGIRMDDLGIQVAFVTAERLYDDQRETISSVFGCRVANGYGGRDAGFIAHECPAGSMHLTAEDIVVEICDVHGNVLPAGQSGEIVTTHMATSEFPFVRYRTGDVGTLGDELCACGRTLPLLTDLQGRTTDFVVARDGTVMHGLALIYVIRDLSGIDTFKIVQEDVDRTRVLIVRNADFDPTCAPRIVDGFRQRLGTEVAVDIEYLDEIPAERSGKHRYVVSHVDPMAAA